MKKMILGIVVIAVAVTIGKASLVTDQLEGLVEVRDQAAAAIKARAVIQNWKTVTDQAISELDEIAAGGSFNTIGVDLKDKLIEARGIIMTAGADINDPNMVEMLEWRP